MCPFGEFALIAVGALPLDGGLPLGAASAVPQRAPQIASTIINFCIALFIVVFLSSFAQAHSRAYTWLGLIGESF